MDIGADEAREELLKVLRDFLSKLDSGAPADVPVTELDRGWWQQLAGLGVFALNLPEDDGGLELSLGDAAAAFEALGEARAPGPLVWTQLAAYLRPEAATGEQVVTGVDLAEVQDGDPVVVANLAQADKVLTLGADGVVLYDVSGVTATESATPIDPETVVSVVSSFGPGEALGDSAQAERLRRIGTVLTGAYLVGLSQTALHVAVEYSKGRRQFDRPIGSFQALKHLMADAYTRTNLARAAVAAAAELEETPIAGKGFDLPAAKLLAAKAADANARTAIQVYGGMGFAAETPPHLLLKRTWVLEHEFGTVHEHALAVAELIGADE